MTGSLPLEHRTVPNLIRAAAQDSGDAPFLHFKDRSWTFGEVDNAANRFAALLSSLGISAGDKVAIFLPNSPEWVFAWFGCAKADVVYVPVNTEYAGDILAHQLARCDATAAVIDSAFVGRVAHVIEHVPLLKTLIEVGERDESLALPGLRRIDFSAVDSMPDTDAGIPVAHYHPHAIAFTSGTTGPSKGALAPHGHAVTFAIDTAKTMALERGEKIYNSGMPLFHSLGSGPIDLRGMI